MENNTNTVETPAVAPARNTFDLLSMIFGIASFFVGGLPLAVAAIIMSVIGTNKNGGIMHPMSKAGRITGIINIVLIVASVALLIAVYALYILLILVIIGSAGAAGSLAILL